VGSFVVIKVHRVSLTKSCVISSMEPRVSTVETGTQRRCVPDVSYIKSLLGILKIIQVVTSLLTFALSMSVWWGHQGGGWVNFVAINGFIQALIWGLLHLFGVVPPLLETYFVELIIYAVFTLFFLIAGIVAACFGGQFAAVGAAAFFCFVCMVAFGVDAFFQFLDVRSKYKARNDRRPMSESSNPNAEDTLFVRPGNDKAFY